MFRMKKKKKKKDNKIKKKNESKRKHRVPEFFPKQEEKRPFNNLTRNKTSR